MGEEQAEGKRDQESDIHHPDGINCKLSQRAKRSTSALREQIDQPKNRKLGVWIPPPALPNNVAAGGG